MKKLKVGISAIVLLVAVGTSFAFRGTEAKNRAELTCTWYNFTGTPGQEYDPSKYELAGDPVSCTVFGPLLCGACVDINDIYTDGPNTGKPMVDIETTAIANVVNYALLSEEDNYQEMDFNEAATVKAN